MKKIIFSFALIISLLSVNTQRSYAFLGFGDIVFDPSAFGQFLVAQGTRIGQFAEDVMTTGFAGTSAAQETISTIKQTITDPIKDALLLISIAKSGKQIQSLVLGSLGNNNALLVSNPQQYIEQKGRDAVRQNLSIVDKANGAYSNSIFNTVTKMSQARSDPKAQLTSLSKSSIPSIVQKKLCFEGPEVLNDIAQEDVGVDKDGNVDDALYADRREELYNALCIGTPDGPDNVELAEKLEEINRLRPDIGGWETYLSVVGGDNAYTKNVKAVSLIEATRAEDAAARLRDLANGKGIRSNLDCDVPATTTEPGGVPLCPLGHEIIANLGSQLSESFKTAINTPLDMAKHAYGSQGGMVSMFSDIASIIGTVKSLNTALSSGNGSANNGTQYGTSNSTYPSGTSPNTASTRSTATQDLAAGSTERNKLAGPIKRQLSTHTTALNDLEDVDKKYLSEISLVSSAIEGVGSCYNQLRTDFPSLANDQRVSSGLDFYSSRKANIDGLKNTISDEFSSIARARAVITKTMTVASSSNSSEEISNAYSFYQDTFDNEGLPSTSSSLTRQGELMRFAQKNKADLEVNMEVGGSIGVIPQHQKDCAAIRQQETSRNGNGG